MWRLKRAEGALGLVVFVAGVALGVMSLAIPVNLGVQTLSARFFPQLLALVLAGSGLAMLVAPGPDPVREVLDSLLSRRRLLFVGAIAVYFLAFRHVDFRAGTFVFMVVSMWLLGSRSWTATLGLALAVSLGVFVLFRYGFNVLLPVWG